MGKLNRFIHFMYTLCESKQVKKVEHEVLYLLRKEEAHRWAYNACISEICEICRARVERMVGKGAVWICWGRGRRTGVGLPWECSCVRVYESGGIARV